MDDSTISLRGVVPMNNMMSMLLLSFAFLAVGADSPPRIVFDVNFELNQGDEAYIPEKRLVIKQMGDYEKIAKLFLAKDTDGLQELTEKGAIYWTDTPTRVRVLEKNGFKDPSMFEIRILDGPSRGQTGYCLNGSVFRGISSNQRKPNSNNRQPSMGYELELRQKRMCMQYFEQIIPRMDLTKKQTKTLADRLLTLGQELEQEGDKISATRVYRIIEKEYPGTPQAVQARSKLDDLINK